MPSDALVTHVRQVVANIFSLPLEQVTLASSPATIETWDSMAALSLTLELEQEFDVAISPEQAEVMYDVGAIAAQLEQMGVQE